jgi:uncharacterized protein
MLLDLSKLLLEDGKVLETGVELEMQEFSTKMGTFPVSRKGPLALTVVHTGNRVLEITGETEMAFRIPCARCLTPVEYPIALHVERTVDMNLTEAEREEKEEETNFVAGEMLDPEILVRNELLINWPVRVLCREDCKGICSRCGANLNQGSCDCEAEPSDPRMAVIRDIFSKAKEV